jgi:cytoskeletal protein CcmA (bactofilin family)
MWNAKKPNAPDPRASQSQSPQMDKKGAEMTHTRETTSNLVTGRLGSSLRVKGDITGTEDLVIEGSVEGMIRLEDRKLTVGTAAKVTADINARDVVVFGYVQGNVRATGRIEIKKDGSVIGNLTTAQIMIEDGADFKGSIEIDRSKPRDTSSSARAASAGAGV